MVRLNRVSKFRRQYVHTRIDLISTERVSILSTSRFSDPFHGRFFSAPDPLQKSCIEQITVFLGNEPGQSLFDPDLACFWRLKPNVVAPAERGNWWGRVMSNSQRMRSREVSVSDTHDRLRVLCMGDSTTLAFASGLRRRLAESVAGDAGSGIEFP